MGLKDQNTAWKRCCAAQSRTVVVGHLEVVVHSLAVDLTAPRNLAHEKASGTVETAGAEVSERLW